eukprot:12926808-Prorocentrum_lima.AAC.1
MPYQSERREVHCAACGEMAPYFRLMESWRPEHQYAEPMTLAQAEGKEPATKGQKDLLLL